MFYLSKDNTKILDSQQKIVGFITKAGKFTQTQSGCDYIYKDGLCSMELEQVSEILQRIKISTLAMWDKV